MVGHSAALTGAACGLSLGNPMLTQEKLFDVFTYSPCGRLIRRGHGRQAKIGFKTTVEGKPYRISRLVWLWHFGTFPKLINHIDHNKLNNKIENLREASMSQIMSNVPRRPMCGIEKVGRKFRVRIQVKGQRISLGRYKTIAEAQAAYTLAADKYFGTFASYRG